MIKVTLDTNVLISGTFWTGDSFRILELINKKLIDNITSQEILEEYRKVCLSEEIMDKTSKTYLHILKSIEKITVNSVIILPTKKINAVKDDSSDNKIIEAAVEGKVDYIVSKDNHLLKLKNFGSIKVISPETFLSLHSSINKK